MAALLLCAPLAPAASASPGPPVRRGEELLVRMRTEGLRVEAAHAEARLRDAGAEPIAELAPIGVRRVRAPAGQRAAVKRRLLALPEVEFVEENEPLAPAVAANDPLYADQWHLEKLDVETAWDLDPPVSAITIAILDSGVDLDHPDLRLRPGRNVFDDDDKVGDVSGHGTRVAGAAAARSHNALGVASPPWRDLVLPVRVTDTDGYAYPSTLAEGLIWAANNGARVANMSFSGVAASQTINNAARYFVERGGVVIAGAGNSGGPESSADSPWILSVSASDENDALTSFSSTGQYVDLAAPGVRIHTTALGGGYAKVSGTSYSGPLVAGVVALLLALDPDLDAFDVEAILAGTAVDLGAPGWDPKFGYGRVDAGAAAQVADLTSRGLRPACSDGLDNDGDGAADFPADDGCTGAYDLHETAGACGLGFELALLLPALAALRARRISSRACRSSSR